MKLLPAGLALTSLTLSSLWLALPPAAAQATPPAAASAASAPSYGARAELATALNKAIELFQSGKTAEAKAAVDQALATTANPQPAETAAMQRLRGLMALQLNQPAEGVQALEAALAANAQSPADQLLCEEALARAHFALQQYPLAVQWARKAQAQGSKAPSVQAVLVRATYLQNDHPGTIALLEAQQRAAPLSADDLRILAAAYGQTKDEAKYLPLAERLLIEHGRTQYWPDLLSRAPLQAGWQPRWDVDLYRLRLLLDLMDDADDYLVLADMAARAGLPAEAQKVLDAGYAKGMLGKGSRAAEQQKLRASVTAQAGADRANLNAAAAQPAGVADARAAATAFNTGLALVSIGRAEQGLDWMKRALGGPLPDPAQARLQYGQALHAAGRSAEAAEQFKALAGQDGIGLLARLWLVAVKP
jgi:hypothetical protein